MSDSAQGEFIGKFQSAESKKQVESLYVELQRYCIEFQQQGKQTSPSWVADVNTIIVERYGIKYLNAMKLRAVNRL